MPTMLPLWNQERGNWCHLYNHLKKHRERISSIVRTRTFYKKRWRHISSCRLKPQSVPSQNRKICVQSVYTHGVCAFKQLWGVISAMNPDPITDITKHVRVITEIGQHLLNKGGL